MEATQESTQPCADPRRMGLNNSGLHDQDLADIICILHPNSHTAHDAVAATAATGTQHILQQGVLDFEGSKTAALDVALRLSSNVYDLAVGFCFGRNRARCDILLAANDNAKRVSNCHFRIYLTGDGIVMLQDTSTNGTIVDNCRLRKGSKDNSRMLVNGSVVQVVSGDNTSDEVRFVVRIPSRENFAVKYTQNVLQYFERAQQVIAGNAHQKGRKAPSQPVLPWSVGNAFGMHWSGSPMYNVTGQIGKGAFATVYKLATKQHGTIFAAKELDKRRFMKNGILDQKVDNEMKIMRDLKHPNIVQYVDHHEHDRWIYIIMEYVPGGELSTYLQSPGRIPEDMVQTIARQLLRALNYLHKRRITHRDIKPDNILIASVDPLRVKLSDFGLSKATQEETFLKTFCGTLLYCAPEVYPDYETYRLGEARKRRRVGDPPPKTSPYSQSVDMWSLGAVLYHVLCGVPPYSGRAEDRGVAMLRSIMTTEADFDVLRQVGVSENGVDFVSKLLNRDPFARLSERECFQHPWIVDVPDVDEYEDDDDVLADRGDGLSVIGEEAEGDLDASQLSLHDNEYYTHGGGGDESSSNEALAKRPRIEYIPSDIRYPSLPKIESFQDSQVAADHQARRLFGEVTPSALRSSHALGNTGAWDRDSDVENFASSGESMSDERSVYSVISLPENPCGGTAPSLMGAENLVGRLNMNSSHPILHPEVCPVNEFSIRQTNLKQPLNMSSFDSPPVEENMEPHSNVHDVTPKAPNTKASRRVELDLPETASEESSDASPQLSRQNSCRPPDRTSEAQVDIELLTTLDAQTGQAILNQQLASFDGEASDIIVHRPDIPSVSASMPTDIFTKPPKLLGRLKSVQGSIFDVNIRLEDRMTSWGRGPLASVRHENNLDTRIPAYALEITFFAPGINATVAKGQDWMSMPGLKTILSTKTSKCIWVNGTELRRASSIDGGAEELNYGTIYTGDVITVYRGKRDYLDLKCEFYHGESAQSRPADEPTFTVHQIPLKGNRIPLRPTQVKEPVA